MKKKLFDSEGRWVIPAIASFVALIMDICACFPNVGEKWVAGFATMCAIFIWALYWILFVADIDLPPEDCDE